MKDAEMIRVENLKKQYRLGEIGGTTAQHALQSWWAARRGKEDPNKKIGASEVRMGELFYALDGVSMSIVRGETVGIIGANGAGKSTLLKILSRVTAPTEGKVELNGRITSMLEVGTGFDGEMTGIENIYLNGMILGMTRSEIRKKLDEIIEFSELREFIETPVKRYSSGMYTKLGFSVASHLDSEILIMDEVLAVGDVSFQNKCIAKMRQAAAEEGRTVLYVSHNMSQIRQLCRRCIVLGHGKVLYDGDTEEAIETYLGQFRSDIPRIEFRPNRPSWLHDTRVRMQNAYYPGRETVCFTGSEPVVTRIRLKAFAPVRNVCFRAEIRSMNGSRIGTYFFENVCDCAADEEREITISWNPGRFADGSFLTTYVLYLRDEIGTNTNLDVVDGLGFVHDGSEAANGLQWQSNWGFMELPDGKFIEDRQTWGKAEN